MVNLESMPQPQARPFRVAELDHVVLRCVHQQQTLEFYTGILGMTEERRIEKIGLIQLRAGHSMLDLVPAENLTSQGYGEQYPVADNSTEQGREQNRRIAMRVTQK